MANHYQLNSAIPVDNPRRLEVEDFYEQRTDETDPDSVTAVHIKLRLRSNSGRRPYGRYTLIITNGPTDQLKLRAAEEFVEGMELQEILVVHRNALNIADAMTQVRAAWRSGAIGSRKEATFAVLKSLNIIQQSTLPGT
jgi:hypothetical protein